MAGMDEWTAFLKARLDEDEAAAQKAAGVGRLRWAALGGMVVDADDPDWAVTTDTLGDLAAHIARHDPARALREVEAGRKLLAAYDKAVNGHAADLGVADALEAVIRDRAAAWSGHPDYPGR